MDASAATDAPYRPSQADAVSIALFSIVGAAIAVWICVQAAIRIVELVSPGPIRVSAEFLGTPVPAPIGTGGSAVDVALDRATLTVDALPIASIAAGVIGQILLAATTVTVVLCLVLLSRNILRGRVFGRANSALVGTAGIVGLLGSASVPFFGNMVANGAFATIGDFDHYAVLSIQPFTFVLGTFVFAIIATAFAVGARLQRDAEGLV